MKKHLSTVESVTYTLDASTLNRAGVLSEPNVGRIIWADGCSASFETHWIGESGGLIGAWVQLRCLMHGVPVQRDISAWTLGPGLNRWGFQCHGFLTTRLYFFRGAIGCRRCFNLTYQSQQTSHSRWRAFRQFRQLGVYRATDRTLMILAGIDRLPPVRPRASIELLPPTNQGRRYSMA